MTKTLQGGPVRRGHLWTAVDIGRENERVAHRNQRSSAGRKSPAAGWILLAVAHGRLRLVAAGMCPLGALDHGRCGYCGAPCQGRVCPDCDHLVELDPLAPR